MTDQNKETTKVQVGECKSFFWGGTYRNMGEGYLLEQK